MYRCRSAIVPVIGMLALVGASTVAQPPAANSDRQKELSVFLELAKSYQVRLEERDAKLHEEPLIRWSKPVSGIEDAALFVWMLDGRPVVAGSFLRQKQAGRYHELQSLAMGPLETRLGPEKFWAPTGPGIAFEPLTDTPLPAVTSGKRLSQLKALARRFRSETIKGAPAYSENSVWLLRLLPQPLLRFSDARHPEREGAVFAFCQETDPEVLLILESRFRDGQAGWEFALAPMTGWSAKVWFDDRQIWSQPRLHPSADPKLPYFVSGPHPFQNE